MRPSENAEYVRVVNEREKLRTLLADEQARRGYYQDIVYDVCRQLDVFHGNHVSKGTGVVCGTADTPSTEVQEQLAHALRNSQAIPPESHAHYERLKQENEILRRERIGEVWIWQGDEYDHPESLVCPVLIQPNDLRDLLAERQAALQACLVMAPSGDAEDVQGLLARMTYAVGLARRAVGKFVETNSPPLAEDERHELEMLRIENKELRKANDPYELKGKVEKLQKANEDLQRQLNSITENRNFAFNKIGELAEVLGFPERDAHAPDALIRKAREVMTELQLRREQLERLCAEVHKLNLTIDYGSSGAFS